jgi:hypothetical protein
MQTTEHSYPAPIYVSTEINDTMNWTEDSLLCLSTYKLYNNFNNRQ